MVEGQAEGHHLTNTGRGGSFVDDGDFRDGPTDTEDGALGQIEDGGEDVNVIHTQIGNSKRTIL